MHNLALNAFGNGLTISSNIGAAPVGSQPGPPLHVNIGIAIFVVGSAVAVINQLLLKKKDFLSFAGEVAFIASFSCFINLFTRIAVGFFRDRHLRRFDFLLPKGQPDHAPQRQHDQYSAFSVFKKIMW